MASTDDNNEDFLRLLAQHDPAIRAFIRASIPDVTDVAEVMQNVSIVAWKKFSDLANPETDFGRWACVIARYEILRFRRSKARDRLMLDPDIVEKLADEGIEETSAREHWLRALETCLTKLPETNRDLLLKAYQPEVSMKSLAAGMNKKPNALYQTLSRLRLSLVDCIEGEVKNEAR